MTVDANKLKDLIHEVAYAARDVNGFGRTKLYKVMWFFEARLYATKGETFSGAEYLRDRHGPRLKNFNRWFSELEAEGRVECFDERYYGHVLKRVKAKIPPQPGLLNGDQARDLRYWIRYVAEKTAEEISEESHNYGWEIVRQGDAIPLAALMAERVRSPNDEEIEWAKRRARELGRA